jgi:hypothetical protein
MIRLRHSLAAVAGALLFAAGASSAETTPPGTPANLEPLPDIPPPYAGEEDLEPQVTTTRNARETVQEARVNGRLVWIKVTPRHGRPYYLVPDSDEMAFVRRDSLDPGLKVPLWVIFSF